MIFILLIIYIILPIVLIYACENSSVLGKVGAVILAYAFGLVLGNLGIIPNPGEFLENVIQSGGKPSMEELQHWAANGLITHNNLLGYRILTIQDLLLNITIPLALPLLLFSLNIKHWIRVSVKAFTSMFLAIVAAITFITIGFYLFRDGLNGGSQIAGMLVGLYTGGTPNLAALKEMLNVDAETYIITHTYDTAVSVVYLLFIITVGKYLFRSFMLPYPKNGNSSSTEVDFSEKAYSDFFTQKNLKGLSVALLVALLIVVISAGLAMLVDVSSFMLVVILSITTLSIAVSLWPRIHSISKTFELGMYFIVVFSLVVASMADIDKLLNISSSLFYYISFVVFGSFIIHAALCKIFKVDADTFMVTSAALICSPPFVPMVAGPLGNKEVIVSGLTVGIVGYAIGNYLGVVLASLL